MRRMAIAVVVAVFLCGCPDANTGKMDPYLTAHTIINQAGVALTVAEGIFNQWVYAQTDVEKVQKAQLTFAKIKTLVAHGLELAHDGVYLARQAKEQPDVIKLLAQADVAWNDLRSFLTALLDSGNPGIIVDDLGEAEPGEHNPDMLGGVSARVMALTSKTNPIDALPASIVPEL